MSVVIDNEMDDDIDGGMILMIWMIGAMVRIWMILLVWMILVIWIW